MANRKMNQQQQAAYKAQHRGHRGHHSNKGGSSHAHASSHHSKDESVLLCTSGYDRQIRFWEAPTGICNRQISTGESQVNVLVISPDKKLLASGGNSSIKLYALSPFSREPVQTLEGHSNNVMALGFPLHQKWLFSASEDGTVKIWDRRSSVCQRDHTVLSEVKKKTAVNTAVLHPNQGEIVCGDQSGAVSIYDIAADKVRTRWRPEANGPAKNAPIRAVTVSSDATLLIAANDRATNFVYKPNQNQNQSQTKEVLKESEEKTPLNQKNLVTTHNARADKLGMYTLTHKVQAHDTYCLASKLSPDARYLATASADHSIKIFSVLNNFKLHAELKGHRKWVWDVAFSADSAYLVSASTDKTAKLWDVKKGQKIISYEDHTKGVTCVALNDSSTG